MVQSNPDQLKQILFEVCIQTEDALFDNILTEFDEFFAAEANTHTGEEKYISEHESIPTGFYETATNPAEDHATKKADKSGILDPTDF